MYIVFEGPDGSGKSTQVRRVAQYLQQVGMDTVICTEPWDRTDIGKLLRKELSEGKYRKAHAALFLADRMALQESFVGPQLKAGKIVLSDRSFVSTLAYQQSNHRLSWLLQLHTSMLCYPDHIVYVDVTPKVAAERIASRGGKKEIYESVEVQKHIRINYMEVLDNRMITRIYQKAGLVKTPTIHIVDGDLPEEEVTKMIVESIEDIPAQIPLPL